MNINLIKAARGDKELDLVIKNILLVNIFTKEIYPSEIGIYEGYIAHINQADDLPLQGKEEYDAKGKYAIPGLIDTHVHIESSMMNPLNFAKAIIPHGTTSIACDPHEIGNVMGIKGIKYILDSSKDLPLNVFVLASSCVPSVLKLETAGAMFTAKEIDELLSWDRVIGLAEVMDYEGVISCDQRMVDIINVAKKHNVFIQGHAPSLLGRKLSAYQCAGVNSDHETSFTQEAKYKLRAGMTLECRESSIVKDMQVLTPVLDEFSYPVNTTLCTDDREPDDLVKEGHIDCVIRKAISCGANPIEIIKMATYNASMLLRLYNCGSLVAGNKADVVLLDSLEEFVVNEVFIDGKLVAKDNKMCVDINSTQDPVEVENTIILQKEIIEKDFKISCEGSTAKVNVIAFNKEKHIVTERREEELPIVDNFICIDDRSDLCTLAIFERHGKNANRQVAFVKDFGLAQGAVASTVCHDCHNLVVIGKNRADMVMAVQEIIRTNGGIVCVNNNKRIAGIDLPIAGLMSPKHVDELAGITHELKQAIRSLGIDTVSPIIQIAAFALAVIPEIRLTDMGLVNVMEQKIIPTVISSS